MCIPDTDIGADKMFCRVPGQNLSQNRGQSDRAGLSPHSAAVAGLCPKRASTFRIMEGWRCIGYASDNCVLEAALAVGCAMQNEILEPLCAARLLRYVPSIASLRRFFPFNRELIMCPDSPTFRLANQRHVGLSIAVDGWAADGARA